MTFHEINLTSAPVIPETQTLEAHHSLVQQNQNLLALLGDYWYDYYTDYETVKNLIGSVEALFSSQFKDIYKLILGSNVIEIPAEDEVDFLVMVFDSSKANVIKNAANQTIRIEYLLDNFSTSYDKKKIRYITSNIINARLALEENKDYRIDTEENKIVFFVDIFNDPAIEENCLHYKLEDKSVTLLWAVSNHIVSRDIANRFGRYSYSYPQQTNSAEYKSVVAALQYFFVSQKSIKNISNSLNILAGIPFSVTPRETVQHVTIVDAQGNLADPAEQVINEDFADTQEEIVNTSLFYKVETDKNTYLVNYGISLLVEEGQTLAPYQLLANLYEARDYLTHPDWYENTRFPTRLLHSYNSEVYESSGLKANYESKALITHNGSFSFNGEKTAGSPFHLFKAVSPELNGNPVEVDLYNLIDNVLKYNLVSLRGDASYLTYEHFKVYFTKIFNLYEIIKPGFPIYLYPVFDFVVTALFADLVREATDHHKFTVQYNITDREGSNNNIGLGSCLRYDAEIDHEIFWKVFHDTKHLFNAENTYNEFDAYYYSCPSKQSIFTLGLVKVFFEEHAKVEGVPDGTYIDVFYNCGLRYDGLGHYGATLHANQLKIDANIEDCANGWVPAPPEPPEEVIVQSLNYDGLGHHNYTLRYGFFDPNWLYYSRLPLPDLDTLKHNAETVYAGVEDYLPFREVPYTVYDIDPFEEDTAQAGDSLADSLADSLSDSLPTTGSDSLSDSSSPTTSGQSPESPTYIQFYHDGVTQYNSRTRYGTSDSSWNDYGIGPQIDKVSLVVDDFFSISIRDERNHYTDIASIPSDQEGTFIDKFSYQFEDTGLPYYHKHDGTTTYNAEPAVLFDGTNQYNKNTFYYQFTGNLYDSYPIKDTFQFKVTKKQIDDSAALALDDSGGTIRTLRHQDSGDFVVFTDTSPHEWSGDFSPNIEIELNAEF